MYSYVCVCVCVCSVPCSILEAVVCMCMFQVQCYDPVKDQWMYTLSCPFSEKYLNAVSLNGSIYVAGGLLDVLYCYNPKVKSWSKVAELPIKLVGEKKYIYIHTQDSNTHLTYCSDDHLFIFVTKEVILALISIPSKYY